jgi:hypothetical protein
MLSRPRERLGAIDRVIVRVEDAAAIWWTPLVQPVPRPSSRRPPVKSTRSPIQIGAAAVEAGDADDDRGGVGHRAERFVSGPQAVREEDTQEKAGDGHAATGRLPVMQRRSRLLSQPNCMV